MKDSTSNNVYGGKYGSSLDAEAINAAALALGREPCFVDDVGFECDLIAAAINVDNGDLAYIETRAKGDISTHVDVTTKIHFHRSSGAHTSIDIQTWNPVFGCHVELFKWFDQTALLIYEEKHVTFACCFGIIWPPKFAQIERRWLITDSTLLYIGRNEEIVRRLTVPGLDDLEPMTFADAERRGLIPQ